MSHYDLIQGYQYADQVLDKRSVNGIEVLTSGIKDWDWRASTGAALAETARKRIADGVNVDYQRGVLLRVEGVL
jgi:hypothetical protein